MVELLIVIAIIGILAGTVLPRLFNQTEQGRSSEASNMLGAIRQLEETANSKNGVYTAIPFTPPSGSAAEDALWEGLGIQNPNVNPNRYFDFAVTTPAAGQFLIKATRNPTNYTGVASAKMCLNNNATWSGNYIQTPENSNATPCNPDPLVEACCS